MIYKEKYWKQIDQVIECIPDCRELFGSSFFITGASGLICSAVIDALLRMNDRFKAQIRIYAGGRDEDSFKERFSSVCDRDDLRFVFYDANDEKDIEIKADYIIHGAGNSHPAVFGREPVETMLANFNGLNVLLRSALKNEKPKRLLYISSSEVYGKKKDNEPYKEEDYGYVDINNIRAAYPSAKRAAETLCIAYHEEYGIDSLIVRPGHIYGPTISRKDSRASAVFSRAAKKGEMISMKGAGLQLRSYMYVLDCASAILTVLIKGNSEEAYNLSNPFSIISIREMAESFARAGDVQISFEDPTDKEKKTYNLMENSALDSRKLESLGWRPCFDMDEGARSTLEFLEL